MKNILVVIALTLGFNSFAQDQSEAKNDKHEFKCDSVKFICETNTTELFGNVSFKTDIIDIERADKIIVDYSSNEITVSGIGEFTIDGAVQVSECANNNILKYKIGERIAYLE